MPALGALNSFVNGAIIDPAAVNQNFTDIRDWANTYAARVDAANTFSLSQAFGGGVSITGGTQAAGTIVKVGGSGLVLTGVTGTSYDLALVNAAITNYLLVNPTGTNNVRLALGGVTLFGAATVATGAVAGELIVPQGSYYRSINLAGTGSTYLLGVDNADRTDLNANALPLRISNMATAAAAGAVSTYLQVTNGVTTYKIALYAV